MNRNQLAPEETSELRVLLIMRINDCWRMRRYDRGYYRDQLRFAVQLLRKLRA
jgi:hypothetical protein